MATLTPNTPLRSTVPLLRVENKLAPGAVLFALTVVDEAGNVSAPARLRVTVVRTPVVGGPPAQPSRPT